MPSAADVTALGLVAAAAPPLASSAPGNDKMPGRRRRSRSGAKSLGAFPPAAADPPRLPGRVQAGAVLTAAFHGAGLPIEVGRLALSPCTSIRAILPQAVTSREGKVEDEDKHEVRHDYPSAHGGRFRSVGPLKPVLSVRLATAAVVRPRVTVEAQLALVRVGVEPVAEIAKARKPDHACHAIVLQDTEVAAAKRAGTLGVARASAHTFVQTKTYGIAQAAAAPPPGPPVPLFTPPTAANVDTTRGAVASRGWTAGVAQTIGGKGGKRGVLKGGVTSSVDSLRAAFPFRPTAISLPAEVMFPRSPCGAVAVRRAVTKAAVPQVDGRGAGGTLASSVRAGAAARRAASPLPRLLLS